jgi:HlyD family secretion protein
VKRVLVIFVVLVVGLSLGLWRKVREADAIREAPSGGTGVIEGVEVTVAPRMPSRLVEVAVSEGDEVKAGQVVARLDCREQEAIEGAARARLAATREQAKAAAAQVDAALGNVSAAEARAQASGAQQNALRANRDVSSRQRDRLERLKGDGGATELELDRASSQVTQLSAQLSALEDQTTAAKGQAKAAKAQAAAARAQAEAALAAIEGAQADLRRAQLVREECALSSPIDGRVLTRAREPGEAVLPGTTVLVVVRDDPVELVFYLPNRELAAAVVGEAVEAAADAWPGRRFQGRIVAVASKAEFTPRNVQTREDRDRLVYAVRVRFSNPDRALRPGMPVEVVIPGSSRAGPAAETR